MAVLTGETGVGRKGKRPDAGHRRSTQPKKKPSGNKKWNSGERTIERAALQDWERKRKSL